MSAPIPLNGLEYVEVNAYPMAYQETGSGIPVLLVHGSLNDYRAWTPQIGPFASRYRTIAVSLRHCYPERWDGKDGDFTVGRHADDLASFIVCKALGKTHVVGHSRGGIVALVLALRRPELVRSLVLADPGGLEHLLLDAAEGERAVAETARMFARLEADLAAHGPESAARSFVDSLGGRGAWDRRAAEQKRMLLDNIGTGPACAERPQLTREEIARLEMPILPMTGEKSPGRYARMLAAMKSCNVHVLNIVAIPSAAHAMNRDNPEAFNSAVMRFLADPVARRAG